MTEVADVTFIIPHLIGRDSLGVMLESIRTQTILPKAVLVCSVTDPRLQGWGNGARAWNTMLPAVRTEWIATANDDDRLLPNHVEACVPFFGTADVIYTWDQERRLPCIDCAQWPTVGGLYRRLCEGNFITYAFLRRSRVLEVGGWDPMVPQATSFPDWDLFLRLAKTGARFKCVPVGTYVYSGSHHDN